VADKLDMFELLSLAPSRQHSEVTERLYRELGRKGSRVSRDPDLARAVKRELRSILERLGHDWVKYHHEEALVDAAELCAMSSLADRNPGRARSRSRVRHQAEEEAGRSHGLPA
jgi:hypothetical protein